MADFESTGGIDPTAFAADMFPSDTNKEPSSSESGERAVSPSSSDSTDDGSPIEVEAKVIASEPIAKEPTAAAEGAAENAGLSQEAYDGLPKSWRKEMEADWKLATPALRKYAHERETQVTQGISNYRQGHDSWNKVMSPFTEVLKQYPGVNVSEILQTLTANHIRMIQATPEERRTHALALARGYGVDLSASVEGKGPQGITAEMQAYMDSRLAPIQEIARDAQGRYMKANEETANREVDAFFSDPKNEFVNEVGEDILQIMQSGQARNLAEAYEIAVLRNQSVKPKFLASLVAKVTPAKQSNASQLPNVKSSATPKSSGKPKTIDETVDSIVAKHYGS